MRSIFRAPALLPAAFWILAISARETVLSAVTTTCLVFWSTAQAVPGTSDFRTDVPAWVSWVALKVCATGASDALAVGTVSAPMATSPEATEIIRARLAMPLRGWCA